MRTRSFLILTVVTVAVTLAAGMAVIREERPQTVVDSGGPVFPGLVDRLGEVSAVVVRDAEQTLTIRRAADGWGLAERNDYPVAADKVRDLVRTMVQLERVEAKTARPERYARLGVEPPTDPGAKSKEVTLQTASGAPVAQLIVGQPATGGGAEGGTFVRIANDPQTWLARGSLTVSTEAGEWVNRRLIEIPIADIQKVQVVQPDKATLTAVRDPAEAGAFKLAELPKGRKLSRPDAAESLASPFADLTLEDIVPLQDAIFPPNATLRVTVTRADGGTVVADVAEHAGGRWLRFVDDKVPPGLPPAGRGLAYRVPTWKVSPLERKLSELIEPASGS